VIFDREQKMHYVGVAPYRINGVDDGAPGSSHGFHAVLIPPPIPSSGQPLNSPFGFDCSVYVSGRNVNDVAVDGVSTGLKSGMFSVPRCPTITLAYSSVPTWKWLRQLRSRITIVWQSSPSDGGLRNFRIGCL
jgi:hypothetical protein